MDILLAEDDAGIRTILVEFLTEEGYVVIAAEHGADALALLATTAVLPRVILLDLMMPVMSGWAFRAQQRLNPHWADIPVIMLTASPALSEAHGPMQAARVLSKPIDLDDLLVAVQQYCEPSMQLRRQASAALS